MRETTSGSTVVGVFVRPEGAEHAIRDLRAAGFREDQLGILTREAGAAAALLIPGIGPVLAGGILVGIVGAAALGGIIGALVGIGVPEEEARYYEGEVRAGRSLVTVAAGDRANEARQVMRADAALNICEEPPVQTAPAPAASTPEVRPKGLTLGLAEERLVPRAHRELVGEVVVERQVVEEPRTIDVPVTRQDVQVERVAANRPLAAGEAAFEEGTIRIPIIEEEVIVTKRPRVVGEVVITRTNVVETRPITATVRREVVDVRRTDERAGETRIEKPDERRA